MPEEQGQVVGRGIFDLVVNKLGFSQQLNEAEGEFKGSVDRIGRHVQGFSTILAGAIGVGFLAAVDQSINKLVRFGEQVRQLKGQFGATAEETSGFIQLAEKSGVSVGVLARGMRMLQFQLDQTARAAHVTDTRLGGLLGTVRDSSGHLLTATQVYMQVADRIKNAGTAAQQAQIANDSFGRLIGTRLLPVLKLGAEGFREAAEEARKLGLSFDEKRIEQVHKYSIAHHELEERFRAIQVQIGSALLPVFTTYTNKISESLTPFVEFINKHQEFVGILLRLAAVASYPLAIAGGFSLMNKAVTFLRSNLPGLGAAIDSFRTKTEAGTTSTAKSTVAITAETSALQTNAQAWVKSAVAKTAAAGGSVVATLPGMAGFRVGRVFTGAAPIAGEAGAAAALGTGFSMSALISALTTAGLIALVAKMVWDVVSPLAVPKALGGQEGYTIGDYFKLGTKVLGGAGGVLSLFSGKGAQLDFGAARAFAEEKDKAIRDEKEAKEKSEKEAEEAKAEEPVMKLFRTAEESRRRGRGFDVVRGQMEEAIAAAEAASGRLSEQARVKADEYRITLAKQNVSLERERAAIGLSSQKDVLNQMYEQLAVANRLNQDGKEASEFELETIKLITEQRQKMLQIRELELKAVGAFGEEQKLASLETQAAEATGEKRKEIEVEIYDLRKKLFEESLKTEVELGLKSRGDLIKYNQEEARRLLSTGQVTEAGKLIIETRKMQLDQLSESFDFEKRLRDVSYKELSEYLMNKLELVRGNASEEMKIMGEVADEERKFLDERLQANISYYDQVKKGTGLAQKLAATPFERRESPERIRAEADITETQTIRELMRAAYQGIAPELLSDVIAAMEVRLKSFQGQVRRGEQLDTFTQGAYELFTDFLRRVNRGQDIYDPTKGVTAGSLPGGAGLGFNTSAFDQIPKLGSEYSDMVRTWKDATAATIGSITQLKVAFDQLTQSVTGRLRLPPPTVAGQSFIGPGGVSNGGLVTPQQGGNFPLQFSQPGTFANVEAGSASVTSIQDFLSRMLQEQNAREERSRQELAAMRDESATLMRGIAEALQAGATKPGSLGFTGLEITVNPSPEFDVTVKKTAVEGVEESLRMSGLNR